MMFFLLAVEILADLIQNGTYSEADVEKVRGDILREMQVSLMLFSGASP